MSGAEIARLSLPKRPTAVACLFLFVAAGVAGAASGIWHELAVNVVLLVLGLVVIRHVVLLAAAMRVHTPSAAMESLPAVSAVMPAYNEEAVIEEALESLAALDYPDLEIILIDDGSIDATLKRAHRFAARHPRTALRILSQNNSGKASALNTGIKHARGEFVLCVDADSRLRADAIRRALPHFTDPTVAAVGGAVEIANQGNLLTRFQQLEYRIGLNFTRRALSYFGAVTVVPGPIGLFRRQALLAAGGYDERCDLFAEDADLTVRLLSGGWQVRGELSMVAYTEAPQSISALLRQRYRWKRGLYQAFDANLLTLLVAPKLRGVFIALFLGLECFVLDVLNFAMLLFFLSHILFHGEIRPILSAYLLIVVLDLSTLLYVGRGMTARISAAGWLMLQRFTYAHALLVWAVLALFDEWRSSRMDWDKLERLGRGWERHA